MALRRDWRATLGASECRALTPENHPLIPSLERRGKATQACSLPYSRATGAAASATITAVSGAWPE